MRWCGTFRRLAAHAPQLVVMCSGEAMFCARPMVLAILILLQGCSILSSDNREKIAMAALYPNGILNKDTLAFSLQQYIKTFPSLVSLKKFSESLGGRCSSDPQNLVCDIPQTATICFSTQIRIAAQVSDGAITKLQVEQKNDGC